MPEGQEVEQWAQSPHWEVGPWYIRPNGQGDYVAYQGAQRDNPLWWALTEVANLSRWDGISDLLPGVSTDDVGAYVGKVRSLVGQEVVISRRQAEEFAEILRSSTERHGGTGRMTDLAKWAIEASLRRLPQNVSDE
ncbi:hypothetical protein [Streptomyces sp. NBC_00878]|uniref:hypothetical protein n=1 Tax=Streptomyces sp. NBC_00878 TaxID=2975854 RepID=UPI002257CE02|nr:hypothetical protein [Streptomyces sp. NBC_00878]MCX4911920.1 hypothetical protein [Streptomyces sp. NBC_00878]